MREQAAQQAKHRGRALDIDMRAERAIADDEGAEAPRPSRRESKKPWILRLALALGARFMALCRLLIRFSRQNMLFALGIACFILLFIAAAYNAFFKQKPVARPVLFSTRAVEVNESAPRPFIARAISTEALSREQAAPADALPPLNTAPKAAPEPRDAVGELIRAQERIFAAKAEPEHSAAERPAEHSVAAAPAKPAETKIAEAKAEARTAAGKIAVPTPRPPHDSRLIPSRERVLRLQKALRKGGDNGLAENGKWNAGTRAALRRFKKRHGLADNDMLDAATIAKMQKLHLW